MRGRSKATGKRRPMSKGMGMLGKKKKKKVVRRRKKI